MERHRTPRCVGIEEGFDMSGFSPEWLTLREPADHRARDAHLGLKLADRLQARASVTVTDLGCGTGSNIRATYALLGREQHWTLVDHDPRLLKAAREHLTAWADRAETHGDALELMKSGKRLVVRFREADLVKSLDQALGEKPDLVTASALFDLCSTAFIQRFAKAVAQRRALFYTVLTYNGIQHWTPKHSADAALLEAFCTHQMTDKGFGASAGPSAPQALKSAFVAEGYRVEEGDSPWLLSRSDAPLIEALAPGFADAVAETGRVPAADLAAWRAVVRHGSEVGHTDTLAMPK
jgi:SAM-dependent methyltransferase